MSTENAFHASIVESPDDDDLRLIFADWLDDHGQPERADLIRPQCQLARLDPGITALRDYTWWTAEAHRGQDHTDLLLWLCDLAEQDEHAAIRQEIRERERTILSEFSTTWTEPLRAMGLRLYDSPFQRGMVERIDLDPEALLTHAHALFRRFPVRAIRLQTHDLGRTVTASALALPELTRLQNLELYLGAEEVPGGIGAALLAAPSLANLSRLAVTDGGAYFTDADVTAIANAPHLAGLRALQLPGNHIGPDGARALAESPYIRNLEFLSLAKNPIRSSGAASLAKSANLSRLTFLDLWHTELYDGIQDLASSPHLSQLQTLFLDQNDLGPEALRTLAASPFLTSLSALDLADNYCGLEGLRALTETPLLAQLRALDLAWSVFEEGDEVAEVLGTASQSTGLRVLGLSGEEMTDKGAEALASSPYLGNLWRLALHSNHFTEVGEQALTRRFGDRWRLCWADHQ